MIGTTTPRLPNMLFTGAPAASVDTPGAGGAPPTSFGRTMPSLDLILGPPGSPQRSDGEKFARDFGHAAQFHDLHRHLPLWTAVHEHVDRDRTMFVVGDVFTLPRDVCAPLSGSSIPAASLLLGGRGLLRAGSPSSIHGGGTPFVETGEGRGALLAFLSHHGAVVLRDAIACDEAYHVQ
jgi:hypothetical protein